MCVRTCVRTCVCVWQGDGEFVCVCERESVCVIECEVVGGDAPRVQRNKQLEGSI